MATCITQETVMDCYDSILSVVNSYDTNPYNKVKDDFNILTLDVYLYSIKIYQKELFKSMQRKTGSITIIHPHQIYDTLFNIAILSVYYLEKQSSKSKSQIMYENRTLFQQKNKDYFNSFKDFEIVGILVRINDKINRIASLNAVPQQEPVVRNEKMEVTINDLYNYSIIGLMYKQS